MDLQAQATAIAEAFPIGTPSAVKRGRDPKWPYVALLTNYLGHDGASHNPMGRRAYATRQEAVAAAETYVAAFRADFKTKILDPGQRALREQYGLPRDI